MTFFQCATYGFFEMLQWERKCGLLFNANQFLLLISWQALSYYPPASKASKGGSKFNWKKKSTYPCIRCQRIQLYQIVNVVDHVFTVIGLSPGKCCWLASNTVLPIRHLPPAVFNQTYILLLDLFYCNFLEVLNLTSKYLFCFSAFCFSAFWT